MPAPLRHSSAGPRGDIDDAAAVTRHGADRRTAAQQARHQVHVDLLAQGCDARIAQRPRRKAAGQMDRRPERPDRLVEPPDRRLVGEVAGDGELHLLVVPQRKALRFRLVEAGNVADRAGPDQGLDDSGAERAGAAGNDNMTIAKVHER